MRLSYAAFLEEMGRVDEARTVYTDFLQTNPGHLEMTTKLSYFETRQGNAEKAAEILAAAEETCEKSVNKGYFRAQKIKLALRVRVFSTPYQKDLG